MQSWTATVGPNVAPNTDSGFIRMDEWAGGQLSIQTTLTGSATYSVLMSNDDPNSLINPVPKASMNWDPGLSGIVGASTNAYVAISAIPLWIKLTLLSGTGKVSMTVTQSEGGGLW